MNWMTSGRHRALRSRRGQRLQISRFPGLQQHQQQLLRVREAARGREEAQERPWYCRSIADDAESHDVFLLEFGLKPPMGENGDDGAEADPLPSFGGGFQVGLEKWRERRGVGVKSEIKNDTPPSTMETASICNEGDLIVGSGEAVSEGRFLQRLSRPQASESDLQQFENVKRAQYQLKNPCKPAKIQHDQDFYMDEDDDGFENMQPLVCINGIGDFHHRDEEFPSETGRVVNIPSGEAETQISLHETNRPQSTNMATRFALSRFAFKQVQETKQFRPLKKQKLSSSKEPQVKKSPQIEIDSCESTSESGVSQDCITFVPPINWQKKLSSRASVETSPHAPLTALDSSLQQSEARTVANCELDFRSEPSQSNQIGITPSASREESNNIDSESEDPPVATVELPIDARDQLKHIIAAHKQTELSCTRELTSCPQASDQTAWQVTQRTKTIIGLTTTIQKERVLDEASNIERRLMEAEATAIYMCVLVKCFKIDALMRQL